MDDFKYRQPDYKTTDYPLYEMVVNGDSVWLNLSDAARAFDSGWFRCHFGKQVIERYGSFPRAMTNPEKQTISEFADDYSSSK